ncbi:hypothetical protein [Sphingobium yanoikuyae]|uniref:hypothetical protein n=1 Tax=Sphingobium yanoikuyae TaxID=13690 RepID=UPI0028AE6DB3|nr:hypothetical protein [Sphingobium yanoikuyae]
MRRAIISVLIGTATVGAPTVAHSQSTIPPATGSYFSAVVGVAPIHGLNGPAFSAAASDANQRRIARPSKRLSAERTSMLNMLGRTPHALFDNLYLIQSAQVQQDNWAAHKGHTEDGIDRSLGQVAGNGVPIMEQRTQQGGALLPSTFSAN